MMTHEQNQVAIFGAAQDTGNLGVTALSQSIVMGLWSRGIRNAVVFDHGRGQRTTTIRAMERPSPFAPRAPSAA